MRIALRQAGLRGRDLARARIEDVLELVTRDGTNARLSLGENFIARLEYGRLILDKGPPSLLSSEPTTSPSSGFAGSAAAVSAADDRPMRSSGHPDVFQNVLERKDRPPEDRDILPGMGSMNALGPLEEWVPLPVPGEASFPALGVAIRARVTSAAEVGPAYRDAPPGCAYVDADLLEAPLLVRRPRPGDRFHPLGAPGTRKLSDLWTDLKLTHEARRRTLLVESAGRIVWAAGLRLADPFRITDRTRNIVILEMAALDGRHHDGADRPLTGTATPEQVRRRWRAIDKSIPDPLRAFPGSP